MNDWDTTDLYQIVALQLHKERVARGEAAQQLASVLGAQPRRANLAARLLTLAAWIAPACRHTLRAGHTVTETPAA
jgi:hypothetical protein